MAVDVEINQDDLVSAVTFLEQYLGSKLPNYDFSVGTANRDIAINSMAFIIAYLRSDLAEIKNSLSLQDLQDKSDDSSNEIVDKILSDFFITRHTGDIASGPVALQFSTDNIGTIKITENDIFTKNDIDFKITQTAIFVSPSNLTKNTSAGKTYYTYNLTLEALEKGTSGKIPAGLFSSWGIESPFLEKVEALAEFTGGEDVETSGDLIKRSEKAITVKNLVTDTSIYTVLTSNFSFLKNVIAVGMHDTEMRRDLLTVTTGNTDSIIHRGSMTDIYGKFPLSFRNSQTFTAVNGEVDGTVKTYIKLPSYPIYKIRDLIESSNASYSIPYTVYVSDTNMFLSSRQELYLFLSDDYIGASLTLTYDTVTNYTEVQQFVETAGNRVIVSDGLAKAQYPLYLSFEMRYYSTTDVDEDLIKDALQEYLHSGLVEEELFVSQIVDKVTDDFGVSVQFPFAVTGELILSDGTSMNLEFSDRIYVPDKYMTATDGSLLPLFEGQSNPNNYNVGKMGELQISNRTTRIVLDKENVSIRRVV